MSGNDNGQLRHYSWFYSEDLVAIQELDANELAVPLSRLCDKLGLDIAFQLRRIHANPLLESSIVHAPIETAHGQELQPCLRTDIIPLWLATISQYDVATSIRPKLELYQRECASILWQAFKPQGFSSQDAIIPDRQEMSGADQAYQAAMGMATLARQQMLIERQLNTDRAERGEVREQPLEQQTRQMAQAVRMVAHALAMRSRRNEYGGVYQGLYRQFGINSYRDMPRGRFLEAMEWLDRWRGDIEGEPEPPPDI